MNKNNCTAYEGICFTIEWYFTEKDESQAFDYYTKLSNVQKKSMASTTFDDFMNDPEQKEKFDSEYINFLIKEFLLEAMNENHLSVRKLSEQSGVSTSIIQNIRSGKIANITIGTLSSLMKSLGYRIIFQKIKKPVHRKSSLNK